MDKGTTVRTIVLALALLNQFLVNFGLNPIPGSEDLWGQIITAIFTGVAAIWAWFKNNYITFKGRKQKEILKRNGLAK